jgi:hypothetical protein
VVKPSDLAGRLVWALGDAAMGLSLGDLYISGLLMLNAVAILHEQRFLAKCSAPIPGWKGVRTAVRIMRPLEEKCVDR